MNMKHGEANNIQEEWKKIVSSSLYVNLQILCFLRRLLIIFSLFNYFFFVEAEKLLKDKILLTIFVIKKLKDTTKLFVTQKKYDYSINEEVMLIQIPITFLLTERQVGCFNEEILAFKMSSSGLV